jgi:hypothetical protein
MSNTNTLRSINKKSAIILTANNLPCLFTLKKILETDCNVGGIIVCEKKGFVYRLKKEFHDIKKYGLNNRISQLLLSFYIKIFHSKTDKDYLENCYKDFNKKDFFSNLSLGNIDFIFTSDYQSDEVITFIRNKSPDFLLSHTPYWIGKKIRELSKEKIIIGSHPGIIPFYRGAHSAFWCKYNNEPEKNGYSIFSLDSGVDSGPLIKQVRIPYDDRISFRSNDYLIMKHCSLAHANIAEDYSKGEKITLVSHSDLNSSQIKKAPGLVDYIRFKRVIKNI